ncbi:hypothetical protein MRX96_047797 [Rhipicephalus microplus]
MIFILTTRVRRILSSCFASQCGSEEGQKRRWTIIFLTGLIVLLLGLLSCARLFAYLITEQSAVTDDITVQDAIRVGIRASFKSLAVVPSNQTAIQKAAAMYQACINFASSYLPETIELVRWMIDMNLDFQNTSRLETVDPVEMMVRGSLELGVEAIISIRFHERMFVGFRRLVTATGVSVEKLKHTFHNTLYTFTWYLPKRDEVVAHIPEEQWGNYFSKYTEGYYGNDAIIYNYVHGTMMIKKLFEDDVIGKAGLQYLVAWSIYRQLAEFTEPYLFRGDRTAEESCFVHVKNVMRLAVLSNYFNTVAPPYTVEYLKRMAFRIKSSFREALENSTWLTKEARSHLMNKLIQITIQAGSPGDRLYPEFVEKFYGDDRRKRRLYADWCSATDAATEYLWRAVLVTLPPRPKAKKGTGRVVLLGGAHIEEYDQEFLGLGPKFAFEPKLTATEKLAMTHSVANQRYWLRFLKNDVLSDDLDSENLGDLVGTRLAYEAFASLPDDIRSVKLAGFDKSPEQLFFISQCNNWCAWRKHEGVLEVAAEVYPESKPDAQASGSAGENHEDSRDGTEAPTTLRDVA